MSKNYDGLWSVNWTRHEAMNEIAFFSKFLSIPSLDQIGFGGFMFVVTEEGQWAVNGLHMHLDLLVGQ